MDRAVGSEHPGQDSRQSFVEHRRRFFILQVDLVCRADDPGAVALLGRVFWLVIYRFTVASETCPTLPT